MVAMSLGDPVLAPTRDDPLAAASSGLIGGPVGHHARLGHRRWLTPIRVLMALVIAASFLSVVVKQHCRTYGWDATSASIHQCYSDLGVLYITRGLNKGAVPYYDNKGTEDVEYPVLTGAVMYLTAQVARGHGDDLAQERRYFDTNALAFGVHALITTVAVAKLARRRVWDATMVAVAPAAIMAGTINWDWWAVALSTLALLAWSRRRPGLAGVLLGLSIAAKFYPLVFLGPLLLLAWRRRRLRAFGVLLSTTVIAWLVVNLPVMLIAFGPWSRFYTFSSSRTVSFGSFWFSLQPFGISIGPHAANLLMELTLLVGFGLIAVAALTAPRPPRLAPLLFLTVTVFVLANKVYSPQYVLWLIPLALLARPRWRDFLVWQATELVHFVTVWLYLPGTNRSVPQSTYSVAIWIHIAGLLYLSYFVVRDIYRPQLDPVRAYDADDPAGGVFAGAPARAALLGATSASTGTLG